MNDRTLDQLLNAWMDLGPNTAPERVADAARLEVDSTRQTAIPMWWPPRRFPRMNTYAKVALASAAVVVAALLGYTYLIAPNVGDRRSDEPTPSAERTPAPTLGASPIPTLEMGAGALLAGQYQMTDFDSFTITLTIPAGWESLAVPAMIWSRDDIKSTVGYFTVDDLFADPCAANQGVLDMGPSVDDLVQALEGYAGITVDSTTPVTISGFSGTQVDFTSTDPNCGEGVEDLMWSSQPGDIRRPHPGGGAQFERYLILDVEGERLVIYGQVPDDASDASEQIDDVTSIIDSTVIEAP